VVPTVLTVEYAIQLASKIAKQAPLAIRVIKQSIKSIHETTLSQGPVPTPSDIRVRITAVPIRLREQT